MWNTRTCNQYADYEICYTGYLIGSSKINFEQKFLKFVLNGLDVGDINNSTELYSKFMPFVFQQVIEWFKSLALV